MTAWHPPFPPAIGAELNLLAAALSGTGTLPAADAIAALDERAAHSIDLCGETADQGYGRNHEHEKDHGHAQDHEHRSATTLGRVISALEGLGFSKPDIVRLLPATVDAAILADLAGFDEAEVLERAIELADAHPLLHDEILAAALGLGISAALDEPRPADGLDSNGRLEIAPGVTLFGRWRIERMLGEGRTSRVAIAIDEVLSNTALTVRVVVKQYDDGIGDARAHALREARALASLPGGLAPRPIALHAPKGREAVLVSLYEDSGPPDGPDDIASAAATLDRIHAFGIAHGDLKRDHIRVRCDGSVFFLDFGLAEAATPESRVRDLTRLIEIARPHAFRVALRAADAAVARGFPNLALTSLRALAPSPLRQSARRAAIIAAILGGATVAGYAYGRWITSPTQAPARSGFSPLRVSGDALSTLARSGRLVRAVVGSDGRIELLEVHCPEVGLATAPDGTRQVPPYLRILRFNADGTVDFVLPESR